MMRKLTSYGDAVTHGDAFPYITPIHTRTRSHTGTHGKHLYKKVRHHASPCHHQGISDLANAVQRLTIDRRDPEKFHADKSEIVAALRRIAREVQP